MPSSGESSSIYNSKEKAAHRILLHACLAGITKPRRLVAHFFWAQQNKETLKALKEEEEEAGEEEIGKKKTKSDKKGKKKSKGGAVEERDKSKEDSSKKKSNGSLTSHQALCMSEFEKLDEAEQQEWKELSELDLVDRSLLYTLVTQGKAVAMPQFRQQWVYMLLITFSIVKVNFL